MLSSSEVVWELFQMGKMSIHFDSSVLPEWIFFFFFLFWIFFVCRISCCQLILSTCHALNWSAGGPCGNLEGSWWVSLELLLTRDFSLKTHQQLADTDEQPLGCWQPDREPRRRLPAAGYRSDDRLLSWGCLMRQSHGVTGLSDCSRRWVTAVCAWMQGISRER